MPLQPGCREHWLSGLTFPELICLLQWHPHKPWSLAPMYHTWERLWTAALCGHRRAGPPPGRWRRTSLCCWENVDLQEERDRGSWVGRSAYVSRVNWGDQWRDTQITQMPGCLSALKSSISHREVSQGSGFRWFKVGKLLSSWAQHSCCWWQRGSQWCSEERGHSGTPSTDLQTHRSWVSLALNHTIFRKTAGRCWGLCGPGEGTQSLLSSLCPHQIYISYTTRKIGNAAQWQGTCHTWWGIPWCHSQESQLPKS